MRRPLIFILVIAATAAAFAGVADAHSNSVWENCTGVHFKANPDYEGGSNNNRLTIVLDGGAPLVFMFGSSGITKDLAWPALAADHAWTWAVDANLVTGDKHAYDRSGSGSAHGCPTPATTTTTTTVAPTTTTTTSTTSTTSTTTTTAAPTTTAVPATTTTVAPSTTAEATEPPSSVAPSTEVPTSPPTSLEVAPPTMPPASSTTVDIGTPPTLPAEALDIALPETGRDVTPLVVIALLLIAAGCWCMGMRQRRTPG